MKLLPAPMTTWLSPLLLAGLLGCQSQSTTTESRQSGAALRSPTTVEASAELRRPLLTAISSLEGRWVSTTPYGESEHVFALSSGGSAVRELMGPGTDGEMTNMYTLDGNGVAMTHYCAAGNQPRMRAAKLDGNKLVFESVSVGDLKDPNEHYMGAMTLVFVDKDHVEQHWTSIVGKKVEEMGVFTLRRVE